VYYIKYILIAKSHYLPIVYRIRFMNFSETGPIIRTARHKAGLTQAVLAKRLHMSRATISQLENGVIGELGVRKLALICDRLGLEVVVRVRRPPTLNEAYSRNREERQAAFRETDKIIANLSPGKLDG
jgi:transcriptional regulator with XRE-family HTH domain